MSSFFAGEMEMHSGYHICQKYNQFHKGEYQKKVSKLLRFYDKLNTESLIIFSFDI